jgi:hypothetical protein
MRLGNRELCYVLPGEPRGKRQGEVAGGTRGIGSREMGCVDSMAVKTTLNDRQSNPHSSYLLGVAHFAPEHRVRRSRCTHCIRMAAVSKTEICVWRSIRRLPFYRLFNPSIVACGTGGRRRPEPSALLHHTAVTADTLREQLPMLPMIELLVRLRVCWLARST